MKANVSWHKGLMLIISLEHGGLFLEWLAQFRAGTNKIHKVIIDNAGLEVRLNIRLNATKKQYEEAAQYINDNS